MDRRSVITLPLLLLAACRQTASTGKEPLYQSRWFTEPGSFTTGIEGPAVDRQGRLFAVNCRREHTIGLVHPDGSSEVFVELPEGSTGNGIRFDSRGRMLVADYTGHNVLTVDTGTRAVGVLAHEPRMNQPNDIAITSDDIVFASDPNWKDSTGQIWRIMPDGQVDLLEGGMGTTNGIEVAPGDRRLYVNESVQRRIWVYDLGPGGVISNKRPFASFPDFGLDGMRCDPTGNLYVTRYDKGTVVIFAPDGRQIREIPLNGKKPSNLTFGGPDGRLVFITLADAGRFEVFRTDF